MRAPGLCCRDCRLVSMLILLHGLRHTAARHWRYPACDARDAHACKWLTSAGLPASAPADASSGSRGCSSSRSTPAAQSRACTCGGSTDPRDPRSKIGRILPGSGSGVGPPAVTGCTGRDGPFSPRARPPQRNPGGNRHDRPGPPAPRAMTRRPRCRAAQSGPTTNHLECSSSRIIPRSGAQSSVCSAMSRAAGMPAARAMRNRRWRTSSV